MAREDLVPRAYLDYNEGVLYFQNSTSAIAFIHNLSGNLYSSTGLSASRIFVANTTPTSANELITLNYFQNNGNNHTHSISSIVFTYPVPISGGGTNATSFTTTNGIIIFDGTRLVTQGKLTDYALTSHTHTTYSLTSHNHTLTSLSDFVISTLNMYDSISWNGSNWITGKLGINNSTTDTLAINRGGTNATSYTLTNTFLTYDGSKISATTSKATDFASTASLSAYLLQSATSAFSITSHTHNQYALTSSLASYMLNSTSASFSLTSHTHNQYALTSALAGYLPLSSTGSFSLTSHTHTQYALSGAVTGLVNYWTRTGDELKTATASNYVFIGDIFHLSDQYKFNVDGSIVTNSYIVIQRDSGIVFMDMDTVGEQTYMECTDFDNQVFSHYGTNIFAAISATRVYATQSPPVAANELTTKSYVDALTLSGLGDVSNGPISAYDSIYWNGSQWAIGKLDFVNSTYNRVPIARGGTNAMNFNHTNNFIVFDGTRLSSTIYNQNSFALTGSVISGVSTTTNVNATIPAFVGGSLSGSIVSQIDQHLVLSGSTSIPVLWSNDWPTPSNTDKQFYVINTGATTTDMGKGLCGLGSLYHYNGNEIRADGGWMLGVDNFIGGGHRALYVGDDGMFTDSPSDRRLKKDIINITNELNIDEALKKLNGVYFYWDKSIEYNKSRENKRQLGMIAQEVEEVLPEIVTTNKEGYKGINYEFMVGFLVEVVKKQQREIDELKELIKGKK